MAWHQNWIYSETLLSFLQAVCIITRMRADKPFTTWTLNTEQEQINPCMMTSKMCVTAYKACFIDWKWAFTTCFRGCKHQSTSWIKNGGKTTTNAVSMCLQTLPRPHSSPLHKRMGYTGLSNAIKGCPLSNNYTHIARLVSKRSLNLVCVHIKILVGLST